MSDFFSDHPDLVRHIVSQGGADVLAASKTLRNHDPDCAGFYRRWARAGCQANTEHEKECLRRIGLDSPTCTGTYSITALSKGWPEHHSSMRAKSVRKLVQALFAEPRRPKVSTLLRFVTGGAAGTFTLRRDQWSNTFSFSLRLRRSTNMFNLTDAQMADAIRLFVKRSGAVSLDFLGNEAFHIRIPRALSISVTRFHEEMPHEEWRLLAGERS